MENPKLFISYSWSSPEHEDWVLQLANELVENGVDVILDKWNLKEGHDATAFMEKMVTDPEIQKVILICDKKYAEKADGRSGGVGKETQIITGEIYEKVEQDKFVAVISEKDDNDKPFVPTYYKSRIYIDLSGQELYAGNFEQLLRWIFNKPLHIKPELGKIPSFILDDGGTTLSTSSKAKRAINALRTGKDYYKAAVTEYFDIFAENLERFRITKKEGEFDEQVIKSIDNFTPFRNEAIEIFSTIAHYQNNPEMSNAIHKFFEKLFPYTERPEGVTSWKTWDFDNLKFIIHELFLYCITCLLKTDCYNMVANIINSRFYVKNSSIYGSNTMRSFQIFNPLLLESFEYRNNRLKLSRLSVHSDTLLDRVSGTGFNFDEIMQSDFILFIRDCVDSLIETKNQRWSPVTLVYSSRVGGAFEIFARSEDISYFDKIKGLLNINSPNDLESIWNAFKEDKLYLPRWSHHFVYPESLINYPNLATR